LFAYEIPFSMTQRATKICLWQRFFVSRWHSSRNKSKRTRSEESFQELQLAASRVQNRVFRNGAITTVFVNEVVVDDLVLLQAGDKIPADGELIVGEIGSIQAALNGEPDSVRKTVPPPGYKHSEEDGFADSHALFRGAVVDDGEGVMRVREVGLKTHFGRLFDELNADDDRESPLQLKLSALADGISMLGYVGATFIAVSFLFKQFVMDNHFQWSAIVAYGSNWQVAEPAPPPPPPRPHLSLSFVSFLSLHNCAARATR
jgi:Ca2+-transporting ATPase